MNLKFLITACAFFSGISLLAENDPVLMKINGNEIHKSEFEYLYRKNNAHQLLAQQSVEEYLPLFINFKLKVAEAEKQGLDTLFSFKKELSGYREQLAKSYLYDTTVEEALLHEAYQRLQEDVEVSHILVQVKQNASEQEEQRAFQKIRGYREKLLKGYDFNRLAKEVSDDPSASQNGGDLGYIQGFMTVYPFESAAYSTPVGAISEPVRTQFGYHLIRVTDRRMNPGEVRVAHLLKLVPQDAPPQKAAAIKSQLEALQKQLAEGASFEDLARKESQDEYSARQGGELPWFGSGRMVPEFEKAAFALETPGQISPLVRTAYGWHLIKLLDKRSISPFESMKGDLLKRIQRDERSSKPQEAIIERVIRKYGFEMKPEAENFLQALCRDFVPGDSVYQAQARKRAEAYFSIGDQTYTTADFADFLDAHKRTYRSSAKEVLREKQQQFIDQSLLEFYKFQLDEEYPEFRNLMREYHDGLLLFEVSTRYIWNKAAEDEDALNSYFHSNKEKYAWKEPRFKGYVIQCADKKTRKLAKKLIRKFPADSLAYYLDKALNTDSVKLVRIEKGLYAPGDNQLVDSFAFKKGSVSDKGSFPVVFLKGEKRKKGPESYRDVRGSVMADYQNQLETEWVERLRQENVVEIDKDVLKTVNPL